MAGMALLDWPLITTDTVYRIFLHSEYFDVL